MHIFDSQIIPQHPVYVLNHWEMGFQKMYAAVWNRSGFKKKIKLQFILIFPISRKNQLIFWSIARIWRKTPKERAILWPIFYFFCESIQTIYIQSRAKFWDIWTHFSLKMPIFRRFPTPFCLYKTYRKSHKIGVQPSWPSLRKWS